MKTDTVFKRAYNTALDMVGRMPDGASLPAERIITERLGVSRTTVRKVFAALVARRIVLQRDKQYVVPSARAARAAKRFAEGETVPRSTQVERRFMEWMLRDNARPGTFINELDLARHFGVATSGVREFLNRFQHFGLIDKRPNSGWLFKGFTTSFALELFEIREMFELRSARAFASLSSDSPLWDRIAELRDEHLLLLRQIDDRFHDFSHLDSRLHQLVNAAAPNRFIDDFYDIITVIFHYHYQWNKQDERRRNEVALGEHLTYIEALISRNPALAELACRAHLASARETLLRATSGMAVRTGAVKHPSGRRRRVALRRRPDVA